MCPFTINRKTEIAQCSRLTLFYCLTICCAGWIVSGTLNFERTKANMLLKPSIQLITNYLQTTFSMIIYCVIIANCIITGRKHAHFLNKLCDIDRLLFVNFNLADNQIDGRYYFHLNGLKTILVSVVFSMVSISTELFMGKTIDYNLTRPLYFMLYLMLNSMYLVVLHIQCCAELIHNRYQAIRQQHFDALLLAARYRRIVDSDKYLCIFNVLQKLSEIKEDFESVFGFGILLTIALDFVLITKVAFIVLYSIWQENGLSVYSIELLVLTTSTYILWPIVKDMLLVAAIQRLGDEV